ncbi:MAG: sulfite exporter TauE/SafE family protein [Schwartzia sp. (in: firmicutes)]
MIFAAMLVLGGLLGLSGAGGAGVTITLLTVGFGIPIHTAIAVSLSCMTFTVLSGTVSHFREGDVLVRLGAFVGGAGVFGTLLGTHVAFMVPARFLSPALAIILLATTGLLYLQLFHPALIANYVAKNQAAAHGRAFLLRGVLLGLVTGFLSGAFGIGATAFIQIGLMLFFGVTLYHAIGTTMLIIFPIAVAGGLSYFAAGLMDLSVFLQTLAGLSLGAFLGAKCTRLLPLSLLRRIMIAIPLAGGLLLLLRG